MIAADAAEVLFVCLHNAGRSQMAAALFDQRRRRPPRRCARPAASRPTAVNPGGRRGDGRARDRHLARAAQAARPASSARPPTSWSRWAAATPARSSRASATSTGTSTTPPGRPRRGAAHPRRDRRARPSASLAELTRPAVTPPLARRLLAEFLGSAFLAALVIGSGHRRRSSSRPTTPGCSCSRTPPRPRPGCSRSSSCSARSPAGTSTRSSRSSTPRFGGLALARRARLHPRPGRRLHHRRDRRQRMFALARDQHLRPTTAPARAPLRRGDRHARPAAA